MNRLLLICLFLSAASIVLAQKETKKESRPSYSKLKRESSQRELNNLLTEAGKIKDEDPANALTLIKDALAISIVRQDVVAESRCYNLMGEINLDIEEWKLALENFSTASSKLDAARLTRVPEKYNALAGLARASVALQDYSAALNSLNELREAPADPATIASAEVHLAEVHYMLEDYTNANEALARAEKLIAGNSPLRARIENQKARILAKTNQIEESYQRFQSGQNMLRSGSARQAPAQEAEVRKAKEEISQVYEQQKRYDEKIDLLNSSIDYNKGVKNFGEVANDKVELGNTLIARGDNAEALKEIEEASAIADTIDDPRQQARAYLALAGLHETSGNTQTALQTYRKYSEAVARADIESEQRLLEKSDLIKTQRDIEELSRYIAISKQEEELAQSVVVRQKLIIYGLSLIIIIIGVTSYFIYKNARASKTANQMLALKSLRSQMNPHFIFNALNSVNQFISRNDERAANKFLSEFSRLMRLVLEHSQEDFISLLKEEEIVSLYLRLEHYRFRDKFDYEILIDENINKDSVLVPPMLIQPYIENAVWHGLRYRDAKGFLSVRINANEREIVVEITDNGIGRKRSAELKTENQKLQQSTGLKNIRERLGILNAVYKCDYRVHIEDLPANSGTRVTLHIPVEKMVNEHA